jgi:putative flippase GtrA
MKKLLLQNKQFLLYCMIGGCGTVLDFSIYTLLVKFAGLHYQAANAISYASGTMLSFVLNARFNFRVSDKIPHRFACFFGVALLGWAASAVLLHLLIAQLHFGKYISKLAALIVVVLIQYNLNRQLSFRKIGG